MPEFIHLHNHSDFSLLDGAASIPSLVNRAKNLGMPHLAITDHGNMFGALKFYRECHKAGVNPIVGCEFYVAPGSRMVKSGVEKGNKYHHLILLAKNHAGYKNLIRLSSIGFTEGFYYKPRIDDETLAQFADGIICLSACIMGEIPSLVIRGNTEKARERALWHQELFGKGNYYLELQDHGLKDQKTANTGLLEIARSTGIPIVATNDIHYTLKDDANAQDILMCVGTNKKRNDEGRLSFGPHEFYMKSPEEMAALFAETPEALSNTLSIAEMCDLVIPKSEPMLPVYQIPPSFTSPAEYLKHLTDEGLKDRYPAITDDLRQRADYELDVIISMKYTGYFLIVWDFIHYAREHNIPVGPGRGSGAGSIVAYALKITDIDPIKYGLLFERFLNPERVSMPDFDIDFCYEKRQQVIDYVTEKYGKEKVGQIITFGTLKARAVIRDVARVLDIPYSEADAIAKMVPSGPKTTLKDAITAEAKLGDLKERGGVYQDLIDTGLRLEGLSRHASTHAAGIVIGKEKLTEYVPLYRDAKTGAVSTQYTMELLEDCGLVKMDFLGLKTLTLIEHTIELVKVKIPDFDIDSVSDTDENTFKLLGNGKSTCIFQFESTGMQAILKRTKPGKIEDLIALNALYRPGPMDNIDQFIDSKSGKIPIRYPLKELEPILKETYGVIVYQEQVMEIARVVAGFSLGQADILRRAMGKKKEKDMEEQKAHFLEGALAKGYTRKQAQDIFELLIPFAGYGFNKSHAAAYSILAYKTAYLKANFPAEFMAANLTNEINSTDKLTAYIGETRNMRIEILPPHINLSQKTFSVAEGKIVYGLMGIKNVGSAAVDEIVAARQEHGDYTSLSDFLLRIDLRVVNHKVLEALIQAGIFDSVHDNRATLIHNLDRTIDIAVRKKDEVKYGQTSLFGSEEKAALQEIELEQVPDWSDLDRLAYEKEILGFYFSGHPLDRYKEVWKKGTTLDLTRVERGSTDKLYTLLGMVHGIKEIQTRKGKLMSFAVFEDFAGSIELVFFPDVWEKYKFMVEAAPILGIKGKLDRKKDEPKILVEEILRPEEIEPSEPAEIHIRFDSKHEIEDDMLNLRSLLIEHKGKCAVFLHLANNGDENEAIIKASSQVSVSPSDAFLDKLKEIPRIQEVWRI